MMKTMRTGKPARESVRQQRQNGCSAFAATIAEEMRYSPVMVKSLEDATRMLWCDRRVFAAGRRSKLLEACMAEVDEKTKGQPFRLDTPAGPIFLDEPLWRFAGRSGLELSDDVSRRMVGTPARPAWGNEWRRERA
jgi:hypothetical protein